MCLLSARAVFHVVLTISPQASGLAYIDTMGLVTSPLGRGQASATTTRTCARPLALSHESQFVGRPTPSLSSLQRTSGLRASMSKATGLSMQADSFDPLGLASGMGSGGGEIPHCPLCSVSISVRLLGSRVASGNRAYTASLTG
jgi:hypothetical protein